MSTIKLADLINAAGGVTGVAAKLNRPVGTVSAWMHRNKVPAESALDLSRAIGVAPHLVRPDLYPEQPPSLGAAQ